MIGFSNSDWDIWKKLLQAEKNVSVLKIYFVKKKIYCKVKIRKKVKNYNTKLFLEDKPYILHICWVDFHDFTNLVLVHGYNNIIYHCLQIGIVHKDKAIIRIAVSKIWSS